MRKKRSYYRLQKMRNSRYRWTNHDPRKTQIPQSLHPPPLPLPTFHSQSERPREASEKDALSLLTAFATFKVILGFITMGILLDRPFFFSSSWLTTTHSVKSTVFGATVGWQRAK